MASCISRFKSDEFKRYNILAGYLAGRKADFAVPDPIEIQTSLKKGRAPDYMSIEGVPIVSDNLKRLIEDFEVPNVEFFPAEVEQFNRKISLSRPKIYLGAYPPGDVGGGEVLKNYWWMNLWNKVDGLDRDKSIGVWMPGLSPVTDRSLQNEDLPDYFLPQDGRQRIVVNEAPREHLFRMVGLRSEIFVSPDFADAMSRAGMEATVDDFVMRRGID